MTTANLPEVCLLTGDGFVSKVIMQYTIWLRDCYSQSSDERPHRFVSYVFFHHIFYLKGGLYSYLDSMSTNIGYLFVLAGSSVLSFPGIPI